MFGHESDVFRWVSAFAKNSGEPKLPDFNTNRRYGNSSDMQEGKPGSISRTTRMPVMPNSLHTALEVSPPAMTNRSTPAFRMTFGFGCFFRQIGGIHQRVESFPNQGAQLVRNPACVHAPWSFSDQSLRIKLAPRDARLPQLADLRRRLRHQAAGRDQYAGLVPVT